MDENKNYKWVVARRPKGKPVKKDFELVTSDIPVISDGEVLLKTLYLGLAPVMRMYMQGNPTAGEKSLNIGDIIHGRGVAEIIESRNPDYKVGEKVQGQIGWQSYKASKLSFSEKFFNCPDKGINYAHYTATLGMTGLSAWGGFLDCGQPKEGDVVVVSGAAGGVGSIVVQLAKIYGCKVIGIAGSAEKCFWLSELGVDEVINYKKENVDTRLGHLCPSGIDIYFDNVGGEILQAALEHLAFEARIVLCGSISEYTQINSTGPKNYTNLRRVNGMMKGFFVYNYLNKFDNCMEALGGYISNKKLIPKLDITDGIETMPEALMRLYDRKNFGVQCCRVRRGPYDNAI